MFTSHSRYNFLIKFRTLVALCLDRPHGYCKDTANFVPSLGQHKRPTLVRRINPKKRPSNLVKKRDVEPKIYMRDTISRIANLLRYSTWDSAQEQLEKLAIKWDSYTVNQVLKTHPPMEKTWLFFNWTSRREGFKHDQFTYTTMLDIFGEARRIESMKYVFQQMQEKGIKIDTITYTSLLHWLSNDGDVEGAITLWKEMIAKGCHPTVVSYTAYIKILFDHNRVKEATDVYKEMLQAGCKPNCHTYTVLMEHLANSGRFKEVMEIFSKMQEAGVYPDKATCNILVSKCCRAMEIESMQKVLEYMRENALVLRISVYREALGTLNAAGENDALLRQGNRHLSSENFDKVENHKNTEVITDDKPVVDRAVVLHLLSKQNFDVIDSLLVELTNKNIKLDAGIISMIIEGNSSNCREDGALLALEYSSKLGIKVVRSAYLSLLGLFIRKNALAKVVDIVDEMIRAGISLEIQQSALLVYRLGRARDLVSAVKVFSLLPNEQKNTTTYTALISAFFSSGEVDKGLETFELMRTQGINVSLGTCCVLLTGLEENGQIHKLGAYRKEKKILQVRSYTQSVSTEEEICNLLFSDGFLR